MQPEQRSLILGPDRVLPATSFTSCSPDGAVKIRRNDHPSADWAPMSVWTMLQRTVCRAPDRTALAVKRNGSWVTWTYSEYERDIRRVAKAFIQLGLRPHHGVGILGHNAPEWHLANIAAVVAGGLATGIYATNSSECVQYVVEHSRADVMVVSDDEQLQKLESLMDHDLAVVQYEGLPSRPGVISWQELLEIGDSVSDTVLTRRLENQAVNQTCMLVYTSGTTGHPKGVMLSQDNITWIIQVSQDVFNWNIDEEHVVSYLPLSHIAAQVIDIYLTIFGGATVWFADKDALKGSLLNTLLEVQPTRFLGVPRVYEKMQEKLLQIGSKTTGLKKAVMTWAKATALEEQRARMRGEPGGGVAYRLAQRLVLSHIRKRLGFSRAIGLYSGAAPLSDQTFHYFQSLDLPILELLGSSETCGPQSTSMPGQGTRVGSVGRCFPHFETMILNPDAKGVGEIVTRGRQICLGYLWDEEKTQELIDEDGWVHSGDLGRVDEEGFFYVSGRIKELVITGGGENIAPVPIEEAIRAELEEMVSQVMVVGDRRKHLAVLLTLRTIEDSSSQPTSELDPSVVSWLAAQGLEATTASQVAEAASQVAEAASQVAEAASHRLTSHIMEAIQRANKEAVSRAAHVQKFLILPTDFSIAGGELTPTLKLKRHFILNKYKDQIDLLYKEKNTTTMTIQSQQLVVEEDSQPRMV